MTMRLGIVGAGGIARQHAEAAAQAGTKIAGFCDLDETRAAAAAAAHPGAEAVGAVEDLLALPDLRAVVVAVPNDLHVPIAMQAIEAGKDVLLEKPMGLDVAECDRLLASLRADGPLVQVGFVSRHAPAAVAVRRAIDAGRLGRIYHARGQWYRRRGIPGLGGWFTNRARSGGGVLVDLGVHVVDLILHFTGRPRARRASGVCSSTFGAPIEAYAFTEMWGGPPDPKGVFDVEDAASGLIRFDGGLNVELSFAWAGNLPEACAPCGVTLMGDRGACFVDVWSGTVRFGREEDGQLIDAAPALPPGDAWATAWREQHAAFRRMVIDRTPPTAPATHGREVQAILEAIYRSDEEGAEVEVG